MTFSEKPIENFTLRAGQRYTACNESISCTKPGPGVTSKQRTGELYLDIRVPQDPVKANFYYPSKADCIGDPPFPQCDLNVTFEDRDLAKLIANSDQLKDFNQPPGNLPDPPPKPQEGATGVFERAAGAITDNIVPFTALAVLLLVVIGGKYIVRLVFPSKSNQRPSQRQLSVPAGFQNQGFNQISSPSLESSSEINRQLLPLISKIDLLAARLDTLETELTAISQKSQPSVSFTKPQTAQTPRLSQPVIDPVRKSRPALDTDLIKLAVATSDYELIKAFPHYFVTETFESRQGKEDGLRFSIDGNQDQYDQRSQSEFIAIPYLNETYLIPNLLPNAADPARTIRRCVERNKLYRGSGDKLLSITELATVTRSGDCYALLTSGRVG